MRDETEDRLQLIQEGKRHAERLLLANGGEPGLLGSNQAYQQVWARDSMICSLWLMTCGNPEGRNIHRRSLETFCRFQSELGKREFNEWFHGLSGRPMGYGGPSWLTAMYLYAEHAVSNRQTSFFPTDGHWAL